MMMFQLIETVSLIETYEWSEEKLKGMVLYGTDIYGAVCGNNRSAAPWIHLKCAIFAEREREREREGEKHLSKFNMRL
jgi:hypothetical protein